MRASTVAGVFNRQAGRFSAAVRRPAGQRLLPLGLLLAAPLAHAGQGMYMEVDAYVPSAKLTIDHQRCMRDAPQPMLGRRQYLEANDSWACFGSDSNFEVSIWSAARKVASYQVDVSAWGSKVTTAYHDPAFAEQATLYPHFGVVGSQDVLQISATSQDLRSWMQKIDPKLQIRQLVLPGTHDSGTADLSSNSATTADASSAIATAAVLAPSLIAGWSKSQSADIPAQLQRGTRYLDLRLCGGNDVDSVYTCHAMAGEKFTELVMKIRQFVQQYPSELVIMDMNHWYAAPGADENAMRNNVYQYLQEKLGPMLAGRDHYNPGSSLGELQAARRTVIAAADRSMGYSYLWNSVNTSSIHQCGRSTDICSYWPESAQLAQQTDRLTQVLDTLRGQSRPYLFVVQTQLTPDVSTILKGMSGGDSHDLLQYTGMYKSGMRSYLDTPRLFDQLSGLIFIEDFSNGIDLTHRAMRMMGS